MSRAKQNGNAAQDPLPLTDPATGRALPQRAHPGYYPAWNVVSQKNFWDAATRDVVLKRLEKPQPLRFFSPGEAATLTAVLDRILPQDDRLPARRIPLLPSLDARLFENRIEGYRFDDMPPDQQAYRIAAEAFAAMAEELHGTSFSQLTVMQQEQILLSLQKNKPAAAKKLWSQMNLQRFWPMLVGDACAAYYAHPWSWDEIGYGGPAYPRGYMRLEEGEPEPWEENETRYDWAAPADTLSDSASAAGSGQGRGDNR